MYEIDSRVSNCFDDLPIAILLINREGDIIYFNQECRKLFEQLGDPPKYLNFFKNKIFTSIQIQRFKESIDFLEFSQNQYVDNFKMISINGEPFNLSFNLSRFSDLLIKIVINKSSPINPSTRIIESLKEKLKIFTDNINDFITILNENLEVEYVNADYHQMKTGYKADNLFGKNCFSFIFPEDIPKVSQFVKEGLKKGKGRGIYRVLTKEGHIIWVETQGKSFEDKKGNRKLILLSRDITQLVNEKTKLKQAKDRASNLINNISDCIIEFDGKSDFTYISPQIKELTGYQPEEYKKMGVFENIHHDDIPKVKRAIEGIYKNGDQVLLEYRVKHKNGTYRYFSAKGNLIQNGGSKRIIAAIRDITKRKIAEIKLRELIDLLPDIIFEADINLNLVYTNNIAFTKFGYTQEEFENGLKIVQMIGAEDRERAKSNIEKIFTGVITEPNEYKMVKKNGETFHARIHSRPIFKNGKPIGIRGIVHDISDRIKAEKIIQKENFRLRELDQLRQDFVNRASHELKTPLTSIHGAIQLLNQYFTGISDNEALQIIEIALKGSKRLKDLIHNLLDTSRLDLNRFSLQKTKVDLVALIKHSIDYLRYLINDRKHTLEFQVPNQFEITIDRNRIEQVIINLVSNAIKNTPPYGLISVKLLSQDNWVYVRVEDNGIGLIENEIKKLFKRFNKIEHYGKGMNIISEGSGLGLFLSKEIIELHGGKIWVESEGRNKGANFIFKLPISH
ncbi:MAG: PAS domain S-box protein [Candidatus Lokiarchaeota archaeon]|nr:PAS domain S-box protein [Candidatus Lokiarchaeota archaeon]MBD3201766.1 PAS domain S-box protein [Candidatus Lokiarchaeota archaeon]